MARFSLLGLVVGLACLAGYSVSAQQQQQLQNDAQLPFRSPKAGIFSTMDLRPDPGQEEAQFRQVLAMMKNLELATFASWSWSDCGNPSRDLLHVDDIELRPDPPVPGQNLTVIASGTLKKEVVEGAYADVTAKLGLIKLIHKRYDLCEELRNLKTKDDVQCPISAGRHAIEETIELPSAIPKGRFTLDLDAHNPDEEPIGCLQIVLDFRNTLAESETGSD